MKKIIGLLIVGGLFLSACEEDPVTQTDGFVTQPVIYSIIDSNDTVHYIRIGRLFSGLKPPFETARNKDSIYFDSVDVTVSVKEIRTGKMINLPVQPWLVSNKEAGYFNSESYQVFRFEKDLLQDVFVPECPWIILLQYLLYSDILVTVKVPGLPMAKCETPLVSPPIIWSPKRAQTNIYLYPDSPLRVQWSGDVWNEVDLSLEINEQYADKTVTRSFSIQKTSEVHYNGKYYEIRIPYELIVQILDQNLKVRSDVIRRYFGPFRIDLLTGNQAFYTWMEFKNGINDFNFNPYDNVENGIGVIAGKSSFIKTTVYLDQPSRLKFAVEPILRKYRIIEY
jgi:hypothetical protein